MIVYKVVYRSRNNRLVSCIVKDTFYQKVYATGKNFYIVDNALCFDTEENAINFLSGFPVQKYYELWEAEAEEAEYVDWVILVDYLKEDDTGKFNDFMNMGVENLHIISYDAPYGTMFCKKVKLTRRIK